jgi:hypothetical protein
MLVEPFKIPPTNFPLLYFYFPAKSKEKGNHKNIFKEERSGER